ncbi:MAG: RNA 2',3'-cyclic phosphodiesterase [Planctomycetes bacterium]|nr:RNA 2',3'-cyclic phosphodiesterase [Planctomycetota bacterium]
MARIRTFIAVKLDAPMRQKAAALQKKLAVGAPDVKWVEEKNLHLTLHFLGEVEELDVVSICRVVKKHAAEMPPFTIETAGLGAFPSLRRPRTIWAGISEGAEELKQLHERLEGPLLELGCYRREERAYSPHLTLGRLTQDDRDGAWAPILAKYADWNGGSTRVNEVLVMSSELRRDGPLYTVMGRGKLAGLADDPEDE